MKKKILLLVLSFVIILGLTGCNAKEKVFDKGNFKITLTDEFKEDTYQNATYYFASNKAALTVLRESFEDLKQINLDSESTLDDYAKAVLSANSKNIEVKKESSFYYFTYDSTVNENQYYYLSALVKGKDGFWLINFFGRYSDRKSLEKQFIKYAKSIDVSK